MTFNPPDRERPRSDAILARLTDIIEELENPDENSDTTRLQHEREQLLKELARCGSG